jgi:thioredoxin reductase (NADPH)
VIKPVIMSVDDDPEVLGAIERDLRARYRNEYRVLRAGSGQEALEASRQLKQRGTPISSPRTPIPRPPLPASTWSAWTTTS